MPTSDRDDVVAQITKTLQDAFYATVGAGVLTAQQLDGLGRQITDQLSDRFGNQFGVGKDQIAQLVQTVEEQLSSVDDRVKVVAGQLDTLLDTAQGRLPEQAGEALARARKVSADARRAAAETGEKLAGFVRSAAA